MSAAEASANCELYNPALGSSRPPATSNRGKGPSTRPTLLPNGKVLVAGGGYVASAELYEPGGRDIHGHRQHDHHKGVAHSDAVADGDRAYRRWNRQRQKALAGAELYDPANGTFTATGDWTAPKGRAHGNVAAERETTRPAGGT